jgi:uncharacterized protein YodC (DUF2158 family)
MEDLKPGDVVRLKSGGPPMTVCYRQKTSNEWWCEWFVATNGTDALEVKGHAFPTETIEKIKQQK